jgi:hypothetical protein
MTYHDVDRAIERLARVQHSAFSLRQIRPLGCTNDMADDRVLAGRWFRLARSVFALASGPPTWQRQYKAAELTVPGSALRGAAAAQVHRLAGARVVRPQLVVPYCANTRNPLADLSRSQGVPTTVVDHLTVTSVAQTVFDLLQFWTFDQVERAVDGALLERRLLLDELEERLTALDRSRRPNIEAFRALVAERASEGWQPPESELEAILFRVLATIPALPRVVRQVDLPWRSPRESRCDALVPDWRLIIEGDGRRWHARVQDFDRDRWRDNEAIAHGFRVQRYTWTHLTERPVEVRDLVVAAGRWRTAAA